MFIGITDKKRREIQFYQVFFLRHFCDFSQKSHQMFEKNASFEIT